MVLSLADDDWMKLWLATDAVSIITDWLNPVVLNSMILLNRQLNQRNNSHAIALPDIVVGRSPFRSRCCRSWSVDSELENKFEFSFRFCFFHFSKRLTYLDRTVFGLPGSPGAVLLLFVLADDRLPPLLHSNTSASTSFSIWNWDKQNDVNDVPRTIKKFLFDLLVVCSKKFVHWNRNHTRNFRRRLLLRTVNLVGYWDQGTVSSTLEIVYVRIFF